MVEKLLLAGALFFTLYSREGLMGKKGIQNLGSY